MSTAEKPLPAVVPSQAHGFRQLTSKIATSLLAEWVGEERSGEAVGRISAALAAAASAAKNPADFYACTPQSIGTCIAIAALTQIMPGNGASALAYVVPRRPRKGEQPELQFMFSHRGLNALARRTGQTMIALPISVRDEVTVNHHGDVNVLSRDIDNPPTSEDDFRGCLIAVREISTGTTTCCGWVAKSVVDVRRDGSDAYRYAERNDWAQASDPWHKWYVEMAMKTAMHYAISRGWCTIDDAAATRALSAEQGQELQADTGHSRRPGASSLEELTERITDNAAKSDEPPPEDATPIETEEKPTGLARGIVAKQFKAATSLDEINKVYLSWQGQCADEDEQLWLEQQAGIYIEQLPDEPKTKAKQREAFDRSEHA